MPDRKLPIQKAIYTLHRMVGYRSLREFAKWSKGFPKSLESLSHRSNDLLVRMLDSQSSGSKPVDGLESNSAFHSSEVDQISTRNH